ncbi:hypothetical protein FQR65_LT01050 [Abscondita terminalis]|nr:hypothetical protein FQR65_LT01050 [Abscondita terminalis]
MAYKCREEIVGKRFLSVSGSYSKLKLGKIKDSEDNDNNDIAVVKNELPLPAIFRDTDFNPDGDQHTENEENNTLLANISHLNFKDYGKGSIAATSLFQNHHLVGFLAKNPIGQCPEDVLEADVNNLGEMVSP